MQSILYLHRNFNYEFFLLIGIIVVHQLPNKSTQIIAENKELKLIVANPISEKKN